LAQNTSIGHTKAPPSHVIHSEDFILGYHPDKETNFRDEVLDPHLLGQIPLKKTCYQNLVGRLNQERTLFLTLPNKRVLLYYRQGIEFEHFIQSR